MLPGILDDALCDYLIAVHQRGAQRRSGFMWEGQEVLREDVKARNDVYLRPLDASRFEVVPSVRRMRGVACRILSGGRGRYERHLVARYDAPSGHFAPHRDDVFPGTTHRKVALSINLNDDYEGGHLVLPECGVRIKAPRGAAILFAASTLHGVEPVTAGSRYAYLTFLF